MLPRIDWKFDFMNVNAKDTALHKCVTESGRSMYRVISEISGNYINFRSKFI